MIGHKCDILNLEWSSRGRDIDIVEPVLSCLELEYGLSVARDSIANAGWKFISHRPRLFLIADQGGGRTNFEAVKLAANLGIPVVTMRSEGMFPDDADTVRRMFWGWNDECRLYEALHLEWSERNLALSRAYVPEAANADIRVSGATGFDRFMMMRHETAAELMERRGVSAFERVIGVAGWTFDHVLGDYYATHSEVVDTVLGGPDMVARHREALPRLRRIYREMIASMPETLFVLRSHPGETEEEYSEFAGLDELPNVITSKRADDNIADLIAASSVWIAYESTTCLEAWLLGKPTLLVNPLGRDFRRARIAEGSPAVATAHDLMEALTAYFASGALPGFEERADARRSLVAETIGWADGRNHERAAAHVASVMDRAMTRNIDWWTIRRVLGAMRTALVLRLGMGHITASLRAVESMGRRFNATERMRERAKYMEAIRLWRDRP